MSQTLTDIAGVPVYETTWEPGFPAVYAFHRYNDTPYYIGMAGDLERRFREHRRAGLSLVATHAQVYRVNSVPAAQRLERNLVLLLTPTHNEARPAVSENERAWFAMLRSKTSIKLVEGPSETWGWCPACGELVVFYAGMDLPATFGQSCQRCCSVDRIWDPAGFCWENAVRVITALVGPDPDA